MFRAVNLSDDLGAKFETFSIVAERQVAPERARAGSSQKREQNLLRDVAVCGLVEAHQSCLFILAISYGSTSSILGRFAVGLPRIPERDSVMRRLFRFI